MQRVSNLRSDHLSMCWCKLLHCDSWVNHLFGISLRSFIHRTFAAINPTNLLCCLHSGLFSDGDPLGSLLFLCKDRVGLFAAGQAEWQRPLSMAILRLHSFSSELGYLSWTQIDGKVEQWTRWCLEMRKRYLSGKTSDTEDWRRRTRNDCLAGIKFKSENVEGNRL